MAAQGERVSGVLGMDVMLDPMAQDDILEQELLVVEEQELFPPQMDQEPEMGAAAEYGTPPSPPPSNPLPDPQ